MLTRSRQTDHADLQGLSDQLGPFSIVFISERNVCENPIRAGVFNRQVFHRRLNTPLVCITKAANCLAADLPSFKKALDSQCIRAVPAERRLRVCSQCSIHHGCRFPSLPALASFCQTPLSKLPGDSEVERGPACSSDTMGEQARLNVCKNSWHTQATPICGAAAPAEYEDFVRTQEEEFESFTFSYPENGSSGSGTAGKSISTRSTGRPPDHTLYTTDSCCGRLRQTRGST